MFVTKLFTQKELHRGYFTYQIESVWIHHLFWQANRSCHWVRLGAVK